MQHPTHCTPSFRHLLSYSLLVIAILPRMVFALNWVEPERLTCNSIEDRTTSGSFFQVDFGILYAAWMQEQPEPGWRIMFAERDHEHWSVPAQIDPGAHPDYEPMLTASDFFDLHLVWTRGSGDDAEIMYAGREYMGTWSVEPITSNATRDQSPTMPYLLCRSLAPQLVWAGYDTTSGEGKIFYAVKGATGWETECLVESQLGPYWTGASPRMAVWDEVVHVVYRGGDYDNYHIHHARREAGVWHYQILASNNINDFQGDVTAYMSHVRVAMSGNDGWGMPSHIFVRDSNDAGQTFGASELVSGSYSATLGNLVEAAYGGQIVGSETSGNFYTGNLIVSTEYEGWNAEMLPPVNQASENPSGGQSPSSTLTMAGVHTALYTNHNGAGYDSSEVYFVSTPAPTAVGEESGSTTGMSRLRVRAAPNPLSTGTWITVLDHRSETSGERGTAGISQAPIQAAIYDVNGRLVRMLTGTQRLYWDATGADGQMVRSGHYFLRVARESGAGEAGAPIQRLVIVR